MADNWAPRALEKGYVLYFVTPHYHLRLIAVRFYCLLIRLHQIFFITVFSLFGWNHLK